MTTQKKEIIWNLVNSVLASSLVILGACSTGNLNQQSVIIAIFAGLIVGVNQFKNYWDSEKPEYVSKKLGAFL
jgi:hypothetical protein